MAFVTLCCGNSSNFPARKPGKFAAREQSALPASAPTAQFKRVYIDYNNRFMVLEPWQEAPHSIHLLALAHQTDVSIPGTNAEQSA